MSALVDRRTALLDELVGLIAEGGLDAATVRALAQRAGVSIGAVQHHFPTKSAMLSAAMRRVRERAAAAVPVPPTTAAGLLRLILPRSRDDVLARVWLAFVALAVTHDEIATLQDAYWTGVEDSIAQRIAAETGRDDARDLAAEALALSDGLAVAILSEEGRLPVDRANRILDGWCRRAGLDVG